VYAAAGAVWRKHCAQFQCEIVVHYRFTCVFTRPFTASAY
jgi:hypothetical protein